VQWKTSSMSESQFLSEPAIFKVVVA